MTHDLAIHLVTWMSQGCHSEPLLLLLLFGSNRSPRCQDVVHLSFICPFVCSSVCYIHRKSSKRELKEKAHRESSQRELTGRAHRESSQRELTERAHREYCKLTTRHHMFRYYVSPNQTCKVIGDFGPKRWLTLRHVCGHLTRVTCPLRVPCCGPWAVDDIRRWNFSICKKNITVMAIFVEGYKSKI